MEGPLCAPVEPDFRLIETLAYRPDQGFVRQDRHLGRMARTAAALDLPFIVDEALDTLSEVSNEAPLRCRLTMGLSGKFELTTAPLASNPSHWRLALADTKLNSSDQWLRHKTTRRKVYDNARNAMADSVDELLFLNEHDELCEGTITNLFVVTVDGRRLTPALSCGLLPGILREELLETHEFTEAKLFLADLLNAQTVYMGNSLRGLMPVELENR
ncbi:aminotransferase class IV family protein [Ruegeria sp. EL01]|jgi:4-amino-4-deoxychorismate lyase|uniref:aminotransferase class IV family protein n=1 Tax=Ruegeria sp. EL01 TaxID=2107578 RepID=UPI000EA82AA5|nr:aminotransferase class IV family protein [Ruegeria sp. EL01]